MRVAARVLVTLRGEENSEVSEGPRKADLQGLGSAACHSVKHIDSPVVLLSAKSVELDLLSRHLVAKVVHGADLLLK